MEHPELEEALSQLVDVLNKHQHQWLLIVYEAYDDPQAYRPTTIRHTKAWCPECDETKAWTP